MDNLTHSLVGAALGRAGLAHRSPGGMAAVIIGANLPDVDILGLLFGQNLGFRRGITHGMAALAIWPFVLTGALLLWNQWCRQRDPHRPRALPAVLLLASAVAILSHPLLDWFNNYGMRWLMPFDGRWFYGDTWFIVDPWVLGVLVLTLWLGRGRVGREGSPVPARVGLVMLAAYAAAMGIGSRVGVRVVHAELTRLGFPTPAAVMVTPLPLNPFTRFVLVDEGDGYLTGTLAPGRPLRLAMESRIPKGMDQVDLARVRQDPSGRQFLGWARFPYARQEQAGDTTVVTLDDARYADGSGASFARTVVRLPPRR